MLVFHPLLLLSSLIPTSHEKRKTNQPRIYCLCIHTQLPCNLVGYYPRLRLTPLIPYLTTSSFTPSPFTPSPFTPSPFTSSFICIPHTPPLPDAFHPLNQFHFTFPLSSHPLPHNLFVHTITLHILHPSLHILPTPRCIPPFEPVSLHISPLYVCSHHIPPPLPPLMTSLHISSHVTVYIPLPLTHPHTLHKVIPLPCFASHQRCLSTCKQAITLSENNDVIFQ